MFLSGQLTTPVLPPSQNGNYQNPPRVKRQFRDPYGGWWDQQERRNFGEPVHEENEILGIFSPEEYTHVTPRKGLFQIGCFVAAVFGLSAVVAQFYPDKPSVPRTFPDGLEKELGGAHAALVSSLIMPQMVLWPLHFCILTMHLRRASPVRSPGRWPS